MLAAIKDYEANKWKAIGQKVGKPAKVSFYFFLLFGFLYLGDLVLENTRLVYVFVEVLRLVSIH